jgi:hypothetical protein
MFSGDKEPLPIQFPLSSLESQGWSANADRSLALGSGVYEFAMPTVLAGGVVVGFVAVGGGADAAGGVDGATGTVGSIAGGSGSSAIIFS